MEVGVLLAAEMSGVPYLPGEPQNAAQAKRRHAIFYLAYGKAKMELGIDPDDKSDDAVEAFAEIFGWSALVGAARTAMDTGPTAASAGARQAGPFASLWGWLSQRRRTPSPASPPKSPPKCIECGELIGAYHWAGCQRARDAEDIVRPEDTEETR